MTIAKPFGVTTAADVLSFIPHSLGYWPSESLVFITLAGKVSGATLRVDLPEEPGPVPLRSFVKQVRQYLVSDVTADGTMVAMYTGDDWQPTQPPHQPVMAALEEELADAGIPLRDAWWVGGSTWGCYDCSGGCCPPSGRHVDEITTSMLNAELIFQGSTYGKSLQAACANHPEAGSRREHVVDQAVAGNLNRVGAAWLQTDQFTATMAAWQVAMSSRRQQPTQLKAPIGALGPESTGFLLASLNTKMVRDCLLVQMSVGLSTALTGATFSGALEPSGGSPVVPDSLRRALKIAPTSLEHDREYGGAGTARELEREEDELLAFRDVLLGQHTGVPDWPVINRSTKLFQSLLPCSTGTPAAALLTMLAWIEWIKGRGSSAAAYVQACFEIEPEYELAVLLDELFSRGILPSWAMSPATAWRGGGRDAA